MLASCAIGAVPSRASDFEVVSVGVRARLAEKRVLGKEQPESFHAYDVVTAIRPPWDEQWRDDWGVGARLLASVGVLEDANKTALLASLIPVLTAGTQDGRFSFEFGAGFALLSRPRFRDQDYGGALQLALTAGVSVSLSSRIGLGYRFQHYSDGGAYGSNTIGADLHMIELTYRF